MNLHIDHESFSVLLNSIEERTGIRADILEKDYYLTLLLFELAEKQDDLPAYFKGGTALYKALGSLRRFSEDIDLTVEIKDCSRSQGKRRLEKSANEYTSLKRTESKELESNSRGSITSVYEYIPVTEVDRADALQRFGMVKVESTSFTISEPTEELEITPLIYAKADQEQKEALAEIYNVKPFKIKTIKIERIFADKILAAEFYYQRELLFDVSKHIYDLVVLMKQERIQQLLANEGILAKMISYKRIEEMERIGSNLASKPFYEFQVFKNIAEDEKLQLNFKKMQEIYVFKDGDIIEYSEMETAMDKLYQVLLGLNEELGQYTPK